MNQLLRLLVIAKQSFFSLRQTISDYLRLNFRHDLLAGLTVSVVEIPQSMAYAVIAGVEPEYGLYTSVIQGVVGALLSSNKHLITGPTNTQSLLIAASLHRFVADPASPIYLELVFGLTLLKGLIQLFFAFAQIGNLVRYVGRSVILGVSTGAGALILIGQIPHFLGLRSSENATQYVLPGVLDTLNKFVSHLDEINYLAVFVGTGCVLLIGLCRRVSRFIPGALIALVVSVAVVHALGWKQAELPQAGSVPRTLPKWHIPKITFDQAEVLFPGALALAMLGLIESVAIGRLISIRTGKSIDPNREFFAQGVTNTLTSFLQCIPGSGSFTRSLLDFEAGGKTRFAAVFNALFVLIIYLCFAPLARAIPLASLAAVLLVIGWSLVDWQRAWRTIRINKEEGAVFVLTFISSLIAPLQYAVFIGIFLSLSLYLRQSSRLHVSEIVSTSNGAYFERPLEGNGGDQPVILLQIEGDLFFAVADELTEGLTKLAHNSKLHVVILRLKRTHHIDTTALHVMEYFVQQMQSRNRYVLLCGVKPSLKREFERFGLTTLIGEENIFDASAGGFVSAKRAIARATDLIDRAGCPVQIPVLNFISEWFYEI